MAIARQTQSPAKPLCPAFVLPPSSNFQLGIRLGPILLDRGLFACGVDGESTLLQLLVEIRDAFFCGCQALYEPLGTTIGFGPDRIVIEIDPRSEEHTSEL